MTGFDLVTGLLVGVLLVGLAAWYLASCAARLDRLHHRVEGSRASLENLLLRRATAAGAVATPDLLDAASALLLAGAASEAVAAGEDEAGRAAQDPVGSGLDPRAEARSAAESDLSRALRAVLAAEAVVAASQSAHGRTLVAELGTACHRVTLARRFHNDAVSQVQRLRRKRTVRWSRLAGRAPMPQTVELDDDPPAALPR